MNGNAVMNVFISLINDLMNTEVENAFVFTNENKVVNFNPADVNDCLAEILQRPGILSQIETKNRVNIEKAVKEMLKVFKQLGLIIGGEKRITNVQWIAGKSRRVISVDYERFQLVKKMNWGNSK